MRAMASTLNLNLPLIQYDASQYDASHPYILGYENYVSPMPASPYAIGWTEFPGEIHADPINISDVMSISMIPIVAKENIVNVDINSGRYEYPSIDNKHQKRHQITKKKKFGSPLNSPPSSIQRHHFANF
jgi:hypothetical protein